MQLERRPPEPSSFSVVGAERGPSQASIDAALRDIARHFHRLTGQQATGELAALRRLDPDHPQDGAFFRLLAASVPEPLARGELLTRWGLIVWAMAQMPDELSVRSLGQALAPVMSEARVNRLLASRGAAFRAQVRCAVRILTTGGVGLPYRELGQLIFTEGRREPLAEEMRLAIARDYWRTRPSEGSEAQLNERGDHK
jgi:CRISPR type I-E-associated protein CasB/Cse2